MRGYQMTTSKSTKTNTASKNKSRQTAGRKPAKLRVKPTRLASIVAGLVSALGLAYSGLAVIWHLPYADQVQQTCGVVVSLISAVLAVFTGQKLASK